MNETAMPADVMAWVHEAMSVRPGSAVREFAGGSRPLWYAESDEHGPVVVRLEPPGAALAGTVYGADREADVYRALVGSAIPVPRLLGRRDFAAGDAMVMTRAPGSSRLGAVPAARAERMLRAFLGAVAAVHRNGAAVVSDLPWGTPASIADAVAAEIERWRALSTGVTPAPGEPDDLLVACALGWLETAIGALPGVDDDATLVQGDTGPGNVVFDGEAVSALVDWELAHLGDPAEDIAWIDQRCASLPAPFGDAALRRALHRDITGAPVPEERVAYHGLFVRARCAVITGRTVAAGGGALGRAVYEPARHRFRVELADMLLAAVGGDPALAEPVLVAETADPAIWFADPPRPASDAPADRLAAREAAVLQAHVRASTDVGEMLADADRRDRAAVMGDVADDERVGFATSAGRAGDVAVVGHLARSARRAAVLWPDPPTRR